MINRPSPRDWLFLGAGLVLILLVVAALRAPDSAHQTTAALAFLLVVLAAATVSGLWVAIALAVVSTLSLNFYFLPPIGTFTIANPQNWVALAVFLVVGVIASQLSTVAKSRAVEAIARRIEVGRLFDLSRDVLLTGDGPELVPSIARHIARRFELDALAICVPCETGWRLHQGGDDSIVPPEETLALALARARGTLEFDARSRSYGGHTTVAGAGGVGIHLVPLRRGVQAVGLLATVEGTIEPGTLDAIGGVAAIAIERAELLGERAAAGLARQRADLSAALLASMSHDLRTPITAIQVAVANLGESRSEEERAQQAGVARRELSRLNRLFDDILDMARIDAHSITAAPQWVTPADIIDAALVHVGPGLDGHALEVDADDSTVVQVDPRLTSSALAHLLENAAKYGGPHGEIRVSGRVDAEGLRLEVADSGPGLDPAEVGRLFEPFYRGREGRLNPGTGMGLAITRGLLAAQGGHVWAENAPTGGACFSLLVPGPSRPATVV